MGRTVRNFVTGDLGWGISVTSGKGTVGSAITGPQGGYYPGAWMTPEKAEQIGLGFIQAAQTAREKAEQPILEKIAA